jgi:sphingomyelin phosphodiesterase acid-like 3
LNIASKLGLAALGLALALTAGCGGEASDPPTTSRTGLFVSDIHFNPLADKTLADQLARAPASQWDAIFATSQDTAYSSYGKDTNVLLLASALAAMRERVANPDIVFVSGDLLVHEFKVIFDLAVTDHSPAAYAAFVNTTEQYVAMKLAQTFPNAQIVPTLGDWDTSSSTDTYADAGFRMSYAAAWSAAIRRRGGATEDLATLASGGYYSTAFPVDPRGRLIVLYTQPWAAGCTTGCAAGSGSLGDGELEWLAAQFDDARIRGQRVWLLGHIPPGIDAPTTVQNTAKGDACPVAITPFYAEAYATPLYALLLKNRDLIAFGIFGHEHADDFRVASDSSGTALFGVKLIPSITPLRSNSPAFVAFAYDPGAGKITDTATWTLTNLALATTTTQGVWGFEYSFDQSYMQSAFDSAGIEAAVDRILGQAGAQTAYTTFYPSSHPAGIPKGGFTPFSPYACALNRLSPA